MGHFDITQWSDYVRGLSRGREAEAMTRHLDGGCDRCQAMKQSLERVSVAASEEMRMAPPDYAVRTVSAFYNLKPRGKSARWTDLRLTLSFDSSLVAAPAGTRVLHDSTRQMLFQSDEFALDVRLDRPAESRQAVVVGQLLEKMGEPVVHAPAYLVCEGSIACSAFTGPFGGFHLEAELDQPVELWLFPDDDRRISVTLEKTSIGGAGVRPTTEPS